MCTEQLLNTIGAKYKTTVSFRVRKAKTVSPSEHRSEVLLQQNQEYTHSFSDPLDTNTKEKSNTLVTTKQAITSA